MIAFILVLMTSCSNNSNQTTYTNPVFEPVLADPAIIKGKDGYFYAYGTEDAWGDQSETKLVPILRSSNLVDWEYAGEAFQTKPSWKGSGSIWAPDITFYKEKYYLYYSLSIWGDANPGIGVAVSEKPSGPFQDKGKLFTSEEIGVANSIDPYFYFEDDQPYLFWGSFHGIYGVKLSEDGLAVSGEPFQIAGDAFEAPYIIERNDYYYFFGSKGSCCDGQNSTYYVAVARSKQLDGPYVDQNGESLMKNGGTTILESSESSNFAGPGHNAIMQDDEGQDWIVYHAIEKEEPLLWTGATRRPLMIDPIIWKDGWPTVEKGLPSETEQNGPVMKD
ncbi:family 43 glycosylhydrolase [Radiobacillus kanasensis]|uniref:family 43 glycosylhydrolase n=1 Tax=Radiobacillus kanasensis TaxID=2844358 RepID=UPI001E3B9C71|nr:family 43 glycosylhydrolase [Radiobacillus kanasensis]UFT98655.1 family 43 glycosylhydrolase [Radiobacillus kanasensis]